MEIAMERCPCGDVHYKDYPWKCIVCGKTTCAGCGCCYCTSCREFTCKDCFEEHDKIHNIISELDDSWGVDDPGIDPKAISTVTCGSCKGTDFKVARFGQDTKVTCVKCGCWKLFEWYE